jgi:hypothetical protein
MKRPLSFHMVASAALPKAMSIFKLMAQLRF